MKDALSLFNAGTAALHAGTLSTATSLLAAATEIPADARITGSAYRNLGIALRRSGDDEQALSAFRQALAIDPDDIDARYNLGNAQMATGNHGAAITTFQWVRTARPDWAQPPNNEGAAWMALGRPAEAESCFVEATRIDPTFAHAWGNLGAARAAIGRDAAPLQSLQKALAMAPEDLGIRNQMGHLLTELGQIDAAIQIFETVLEQYPQQPEARAGLSLALHRHGDSVGALARIAPAIASDDIHPDEAVTYARICLHMDQPERAIHVLQSCLTQAQHPATQVLLGKQLGQVLDAMGETEAAYRAIERANLARPIRFDADSHRRNIDKIIASSMMPKSQSTCTDPTPVFIVGVPRSGSSLLEQMLDSHPDIHGAGEREELQTIARLMDDQSLTQDDLDRLAKRYLAQIRPNGMNVKRITDKMPDNFMALGHASRLFPEARIIYCVRDPADTGLSCLFQHFKDALPWATDPKNIASYIRDYQRLMDHWAEHCPIKMMTVPYESLVADPKRWAHRILSFLELDFHEAVLHPNVNSRVVTTASHDQVRKPIHTKSVGRSKAYRPHIQALIEMQTHSTQSK